MSSADLFTIETDAIERYLIAKGRPENSYQLARVAASAWLQARAAQAQPVAGSPAEASGAITNIDDEPLERLLTEEGPRIRAVVHAVLTRDRRFYHFRDEQGDYYCLGDLLPDVETPALAQVWEILHAQEAAETLTPVPTDYLLETVWRRTDYRSSAYRLLAFALNVTLQEFRELRHVIGAGWTLESSWRTLSKRPSLVALNSDPAAQTTIIATEEPTLVGTMSIGTMPLSATAAGWMGEEQTIILPRPPARRRPVSHRQREQLPLPADAETWQQERRREVSFTLEPSHYYYHWLPLTGQMQWLIPPWSCRLTIHYTFSCPDTLDAASVYSGQFTAWADPEIKQILAGRALYEALRAARIYPGAKLVLAHRHSDHHYDLQTLAMPPGQTIAVRRLALDGNGSLTTSVDLEPLRNEVESGLGNEALIADAPYEQLPNLFQQADAAGERLFEEMFETCRRWELERGSPLTFTAEALFQALPSSPWPPDPALFHWELWRRKAFEREPDRPTAGRSNGTIDPTEVHYHFWPDQGSYKRSLQPEIYRRRRLPSSLAGTSAPRLSLLKLLGNIKPTSRAVKSVNAVTANTSPIIRLAEQSGKLWSPILDDESRCQAIATAAAAHQAHPLREKVLLLRQTANARICALLAPERLSRLTLEAFNYTVWQLGAIRYRGRRARIDAEQIEQLLADLSPAEMQAAIDRGDLFLEGNQNWGSALGVFETQLALSAAEKVNLLRYTLRDLLYGDQSEDKRIGRALQDDNGLNMAAITGILHAVYPERHLPYTLRSVKLLKTFELDARKWNRDAAAYLDYRDFATALQREFGFTSLADVDLFLSRWEEWPRRPAFADVPVDTPQSLQAEPFDGPGAGTGSSEAAASQAAGPQTSGGYLTYPKQVQHVEEQNVEKEEQLMDEPDEPLEAERIKRAPETPQPPPPTDEYIQIQALIRRQLVDSPIWTAAGERAYVAAAGDNGLTIISGRSEQIVEWSVLQRAYMTLLAQGSLSAGNLKEMLLGDAELTNAIIGILGLVNHVEITLPVGLRYHPPPPTGPIRLDDPLESPFAANAW